MSWGCRSANQSGATTANPHVGSPNATTPTAPQTTTPTAAPTAVTDDAINRADIQYQRGRVSALVSELLGALDAQLRARVDKLPIVFEPDPNDVNAFATCTRSGKATIAITDGLLVLATYLAQMQAADEVFQTHRLDEYIAYIAKNQQPNHAILPPPASLLPPNVRTNSAKVTRQQQLNDELLAFVMGHELGHHYLNHLPCTSILPLDATEIGMIVTDVIPAFNQPNEVAADIGATRNVLEAGRRRSGYHLTETGGLLTIRFFQGLDQSSPVDLFNFERTHPPPTVRDPVIRTAANAFRTGATVSWPWKL
jgi:hypothetical protein